MKPTSATTPAVPATLAARLASLRGVFREVPGTLRLVWAADPGAAVQLLALTALLALLPAGVAWVGKLIVDAVVAAAGGDLAARARVPWWVGLELGLMALQLGLLRLSGLRRELLRATLGNLVNQRILEKALQLELAHFEDSEVYDKMQNARREATSRPLSLALQLMAIGQNGVTLAALSGLLWRVSPISVLVVVAASIPAFLAEARLAGESFRLYSWRAPEGRKLNYQGWILTRDLNV